MGAKVITHMTNTNDVKNNVPDVKIYGNPDIWVLLCKASSQEGCWMKSTKFMNTPTGAVLQVTTQHGNTNIHKNPNVAEALTFIPGVNFYKTQDGTFVPYLITPK